MSRRDLEGYVNLLEAGEVLAFYLACMAMVQAQSMPNKAVSYVGEIGKRLGKGGEKSVGTSMGDWIAILREVATSKEWKKSVDEVPFTELLTFMNDDPEADEALGRLAVARNDQSHGRGPKGSAVEKAFNDALPDVQYLFATLRVSLVAFDRHLDKQSRRSTPDLTFLKTRQPLTKKDVENALAEAGFDFTHGSIQDLNLWAEPAAAS